MSEAIIVTIISSVVGGLCVAIPSVIATITSNKSNNKLTIYRIEKLEEKVDVHNHVVERVYELEKKDTLREEEIKVANHRIDDLEKGEK